MKQDELVKHYQERLKKVKEVYKNDWRKKPYIEKAEKDLEEVKNGRKW